jgi:hypothetical protein
MAEKSVEPTLSASSLARNSETPEPYVDEIRAAEFLSKSRRWVLEHARAVKIPAHPTTDGQRRQWRFRLSELAQYMQAQSAQRKIPAAAPVSQRRKSDG